MPLSDLTLSDIDSRSYHRRQRQPGISTITVPFSLTPYLVGATALGQGHIQVIMPMHLCTSPSEGERAYSAPLWVARPIVGHAIVSESHVERLPPSQAWRVSSQAACTCLVWLSQVRSRASVQRRFDGRFHDLPRTPPVDGDRAWHAGPQRLERWSSAVVVKQATRHDR